MLLLITFLLIFFIYVLIQFDETNTYLCNYNTTFAPCTAPCGGGTSIHTTTLTADSSYMCKSGSDTSVPCNTSPCPTSDEVDEMNDYVINGAASNECFMYPYWSRNWDVERARTDQAYFNTYKRVQSICPTKYGRSACITAGKLPSFDGSNARSMCHWF